MCIIPSVLDVYTTCHAVILRRMLCRCFEFFNHVNVDITELHLELNQHLHSPEILSLPASIPDQAKLFLRHVLQAEVDQGAREFVAKANYMSGLHVADIELKNIEVGSRVGPDVLHVEHNVTDANIASTCSTKSFSNDASQLPMRTGADAAKIEDERKATLFFVAGVLDIERLLQYHVRNPTEKIEDTTAMADVASHVTVMKELAGHGNVATSAQIRGILELQDLVTMYEMETSTGGSMSFAMLLDFWEHVLRIKSLVDGDAVAEAMIQTRVPDDALESRPPFFGTDSFLQKISGILQNAGPGASSSGLLCEVDTLNRVKTDRTKNGLLLLMFTSLQKRAESIIHRDDLVTKGDVDDFHIAFSHLSRNLDPKIVGDTKLDQQSITQRVLTQEEQLAIRLRDMQSKSHVPHEQENKFTVQQLLLSLLHDIKSCIYVLNPQRTISSAKTKQARRGEHSPRIALPEAVDTSKKAESSPPSHTVLLDTYGSPLKRAVSEKKAKENGIKWYIPLNSTICMKYCEAHKTAGVPLGNSEKYRLPLSQTRHSAAPFCGKSIADYPNYVLILLDKWFQRFATKCIIPNYFLTLQSFGERSWSYGIELRWTVDSLS